MACGKDVEFYAVKYSFLEELNPLSHISGATLAWEDLRCFARIIDNLKPPAMLGRSEKVVTGVRK